MSARGLIGVILVGAVGLTGCGDDNGDDESAVQAGGDTTVETTAVDATVETTAVDATVIDNTTVDTTVETTLTTAGTTVGELLFNDTFDDDRNEWGIVDDPQYGSMAYDNGDYVWDFRGSVAHWIAGVLGEQYDRGELDMLDVIVHAKATIVRGGGVVGVACRETPDTDAEWQWYEFVARDGFAAIRHADDDGNLDVLAETDAVSLPTGTPITFEAACINDSAGNARLSLTLNGTRALEATVSDPLGNGVPSLQAWTYPVHDQMDIRWHEFSVSRPSS